MCDFVFREKNFRVFLITRDSTGGKGVIFLSGIIHSEQETQGDRGYAPAEVYDIVYDRNEIDELKLRGCDRFVVHFLPSDEYWVVLCRRIFALLEHLKLAHKTVIRLNDTTP